jgi:hypothetical protein
VQVVVYQDKEFPGSLAEEEGLLAELKTCGTCKVVSVEQFSASQVGTTLPADTVSFVRSHPDVTHLWAAFDPAAIVQAAGAAAGWAGRRREAPQHDRRDAEPRPDPQGRRPGRRRAYDNEYLGCAPRSSAAQTTSAGRSKAGAGARRRRPDATIGRDPALRQPAESDTMVWPVGARRDAAVGWEPAARSHPHPTSSRSRISGVQTAASQRR